MVYYYVVRMEDLVVLEYRGTDARIAYSRPIPEGSRLMTLDTYEALKAERDAAAAA